MQLKKNDATSVAIETFENFHSIELVEDLYVVLNHIFLPPSSFYVENKLLTNQDAYGALKMYFPKALAKFIEQHLIKLGEYLKIDTNAPGGWEFWSRVSTVNSPSFGYLHVDNDEDLRLINGQLVTPLYGSILYVGPKHGMEGGETAFLTTYEEKMDSCIFSSLSKHEFTTPPFKLVSPKSGRVTVFEGSLPHAVMWTGPNAVLPRVTFLANYWPNRLSSIPTGICVMTPEEYKGEHASNKN